MEEIGHNDVGIPVQKAAVAVLIEVVMPPEEVVLQINLLLTA